MLVTGAVLIVLAVSGIAYTIISGINRKKKFAYASPGTRSIQQLSRMLQKLLKTTFAANSGLSKIVVYYKKDTEVVIVVKLQHIQQ